MAWISIKAEKEVEALELSDLNPVKQINKMTDKIVQYNKDNDDSKVAWFEVGDKAIIKLPKHDFDVRKNTTTDEVDQEKVDLLNEIDGQEVEVTKVDYTEAGYNVGLAKTAKPTQVTIKFSDGQEWKEIPVSWLSKKEDKKIESNKKYYKGAFEYKGFKVDFFSDGNFTIYTPEGISFKNGDKFYKSTAESADKAISKAYEIIDTEFPQIQSKIVKQDGKYQAQSEKGKSFGTYDTKAEAEKRLQQMEMFKNMKSEKDLSKILTPEDFDKIEQEIESLNMSKKRIEDSLKSYLKSGNKGSEYQSLVSELDKVNNELANKIIEESNMWKELKGE